MATRCSKCNKFPVDVDRCKCYDGIYQIICGDALLELQKFPDNSVDSIVTDPPYGIGFMGKEWDNFKPKHIERKYKPQRKKLIYKYDIKGGIRIYRKKAEWVTCESPSDTAGYYDRSIIGNRKFQDWYMEVAKEMLRVLKPGGYLLSFGGTRTYHRMVCAIEDAGFEIRDMVEWIYGSGFPKSLNIGKAVDKLRKGSDKLVEFSLFIKNRREELNISQSEADKFICGGTTMYSFFEGRKDKPLYFPNNEHYKKMKELFVLDNTWDDFILETNEKIVGYKDGDFGFQKNGDRWDGKKKVVELSSRASEWEGWGTALKPAHEPICLARKPISEKTVAENVLKWGTGGINIDGCRVKIQKGDEPHGGYGDEVIGFGPFDNKGGVKWKVSPTAYLGRFPANIIHDGSDEVLNEFPNRKGWSSQKHNSFNPYKGNALNKSQTNRDGFYEGYNDNGNAARFFYCAKSSRSERNMGCEGLEEKKPPRWNKAGEWTDDTTPSRNNHPTVKPIALMSYLCRLITPPKGIILDPFAGSGSTLIAAKLEGFNFIGIEKEKDYVKIAEARLKAVSIKLF